MQLWGRALRLTLGLVRRRVVIQATSARITSTTTSRAPLFVARSRGVKLHTQTREWASPPLAMKRTSDQAGHGTIIWRAKSIMTLGRQARRNLSSARSANVLGVGFDRVTKKESIKRFGTSSLARACIHPRSSLILNSVLSVFVFLIFKAPSATETRFGTAGRCKAAGSTWLRMKLPPFVCIWRTQRPTSSCPPHRKGHVSAAAKRPIPQGGKHNDRTG